MESRPAGAFDDEKWEAALAVANIPTLLPVLVQLTGDRKWLEAPYLPTRARNLSDNDTAGFPEAQQREVRAAALEAIREHLKNGKPVALPDPPAEMLVDMMNKSLSETIGPRYAEMIRHELTKGTDLARAEAPVAVPEGFRALIIGAGMSGICAAINFAKVGIPYSIIERNAGVGGTWLENRYPGCGVDVPSHLYTFSFAPNEWEHYFSLRDDVFRYFNRVAKEFDVLPHIQFNTEVNQAVYDDATRTWKVDIEREDGSVETLTANIVISAVGAFNKPRMPKLPGLEKFKGTTAHTARWPEGGVDVDGKTVAVIGTGASSMQLVPAIAERTKHLTVFQRSPQWATPFEKFQVKVPEPIRFIMRELPLYRNWYRLRLSWSFNDKAWASLQKDPAFEFPERAVNAHNDGFRRTLTRYIEEQLGDKKDELMPKVLPTYPPYGKRILLDNNWYRTLTQPNVELRTNAVREVTEKGVIDDAGVEHEVDVIIWAIGFDVVHFLAPMRIVGRSGRSLHDVWEGDDARAYLGAMVPDFPNFFCLYGPNTQFGHGGSLIAVIERQLHYVMSVLRAMVAKGAIAAEVKPAVHDEYNERVDKAHENMVWTHRGMSTYYRNSKGRVTVNNPFRIVDVWEWTENANIDDFVVYAATGGGAS